jgi:hypothetical protein
LAHAPECGQRPIEETAAFLHGHEGVFKRGTGRFIRDALDLGELLRYAGLDGRLVILILDFVERRRVKRQRTRRIKRVRGTEVRGAASRGE